MTKERRRLENLLRTRRARSAVRCKAADVALQRLGFNPSAWESRDGHIWIEAQYAVESTFVIQDGEEEAGPFTLKQLPAALRKFIADRKAAGR